MKRLSGAARALSLSVVLLAGCQPMRVTRPEPTPPAVKPLKVEHAQPPIALEATSGDQVSIGIRVAVEKTTVGSSGRMLATDVATKAQSEWDDGTYEVRARGDALLVNGQRKGHKIKLVSGEAATFLQCNGRGYRGTLLLVADGGKVTVIDLLGIDDYLKGVLPREVVVTWPEQALRVQAVASRTYLASHLGQHKKEGFDLCSTVHCQVYGGVSGENPKSSKAVDDTSGQILIYDGKPISAFFHSNCGGITEEPQYVWGTSNVPYLVRKRCPYGTADPRYEWRISFNNDVILSNLKKGTRVKGHKLESLRIAEKSPSGRAAKIRVQTDADTFTISGNDFRIAMDPEKIRSTLFTSFERHGDGYTFAGRGWGHGIGMCQWGAKGQAERGRDYRDILDFYYPHTTLRIWSRS